MNKNRSIPSIFSTESGVFVLLWFIYMLLPYVVVPDRYGYSLGLPELIIKSCYILPVLCNNKILIPRFLYKSRYWQYALLLLTLLLGVVFFEELVLENIFYPTTRGGGISANSVRHAAFKIGFVFILFSSFKLLWDYQRKQQQVSELEKEKVESELKFLKSQINPHVLFNNLNNIYSYALEKSQKVPEMLLKLSEIMRYMLRDANEPMVPLRDELSYLENFIDLQKLRLEGRGAVRFQVQGDPANYTIAPLLLVAFVENSFKHSMQTAIEDIIVDISIVIEDDLLRFHAENTYADSNGLHPDKTTGIGLQNVKKRLQLIYEEQHELTIDQTDSRFEVDLRLNLAVHEPEVLNY